MSRSGAGTASSAMHGADRAGVRASSSGVPVASATVQCDKGAVSPVRNVFRVKTGAKGIKVRVTAGAGVVWNLRVEER